MPEVRRKRKIVLCLVEGASDIDALSGPISKLYESIDESFEVKFLFAIDNRNKCGGDLTTRNGVSPSNIERLVYKLFVKDYLATDMLYPKDVYQIIQIIDTDGAYIPDENVVQTIRNAGDTQLPFYADGLIETDCVQNIIERNSQKRENLDKLVGLETIKVDRVPTKYSVYFFSCNIDHYLHNEANLHCASKRQVAQCFSDTYKDNPSKFLEYLRDDTHDLKDASYQESWNYIRSNTNSTKRHTNLSIWLDSVTRVD